MLDRWPEDIAVPELGTDPLALATPRFLRRPLAVRAARAAIVGRDGTRRVAPAAQDRPAAGGDRVLRGGGPAPELQSELLNQQGDSLVTLPVPAAEGNTSRVEIPLQSLAPAVYVLRVRARTADQLVEQHVPFRIVP